MTRKRALITGITGQDGAYLAKFLLENDYEVYGLRRQTSLQLIDGDILDQSSIITALRAAEPHEVYNLASQSFVGSSWREPLLTAQATGVGAVNVTSAGWLSSPSASTGEIT